ncbi:WSC domain-containing protein [Lasiosphaeria miniovina]|uniref:WSC domain-containing protein n=1 Tax=Lasiosphaeria miniovina TaxID=1954250 RepID=A0AA40B378_9PEZI|nr:WSC domain-containing protein [Lasiosphaeria miniovina]KAK0726795.1 WSC domain-containing protein [Lasiosphaeria miniovina]
MQPTTAPQATASHRLAVRAATTASVDGYSAVGCYSDLGGVITTRVLSAAFTGAAGQPSVCLTYCAPKGYSMFGLENGAECYCGNTLNAGATRAPDVSCSQECSGSSDAICGALGMLLLYTSTGTSSTTSSTVVSSSSSLVSSSSSLVSSSSSLVSSSSSLASATTGPASSTGISTAPAAGDGPGYAGLGPGASVGLAIGCVALGVVLSAAGFAVLSFVLRRRAAPPLHSQVPGELTTYYIERGPLTVMPARN